jgi:L-fuculose-phosphate aldolase
MDVDSGMLAYWDMQRQGDRPGLPRSRFGVEPDRRSVLTTDVRARVTEACRILYAHGQEHFFLGHVSARETPGSDRFWVKPTGMGLGEVTVDDLVLLDLDGKRISGDRPIHNEMPIHAEIYRARPDVNCVVHTHPFHAAAFAASTADFKMIGQDSVYFASGFGWYDRASLVVTPEQGRAVAEALGRHRLVVLRNHGIAAVDDSIESATFLALSFDRSLQLQAMAASLGPIREITPEEVASMDAYFAASYGARVQVTFEYLLRQTDARIGRPAISAAVLRPGTGAHVAPDSSERK